MQVKEGPHVAQLGICHHRAGPCHEDHEDQSPVQDPSVAFIANN